MEIVLILTQDWCTVCAEHAIGLEIILGTPDETPRYVGLVEARFNLFGDSVNDNLNSDRCSLYRMSNWLGNCYGRTRWNSSVMWVKWKLVFVRLEIVLASAQGRLAPNVPQAWISF
jgi:hypothetical protein